jgi:hypothetical protein
MNTFANNIDACQTLARHTIDDRVRDAERRQQVRTFRAERRAARRAARASYDQSVRRLPVWAFRFVHPVH